MTGIKWTNMAAVRQTLTSCESLRNSLSEKRLFDKKFEIRLHNTINYFSYYRFDNYVGLCHYLGPAQDTSLLHHYWNNTKQYKSISTPYTQHQTPAVPKELNGIFKSIWEESIPLVFQENTQVGNKVCKTMESLFSSDT